MRPKSYIDNFERYRNIAVEIENFDTPGYTESGDGDPAEIISVASNTVGSTKTKVTQFPITYSAGTATWERTMPVPQDFSKYTGVTSGAASAGILQIFARKDAGVTSIQIKIGSSSSDYVLWVPSIPATTEDHFALKVDLSTLTPVGTIDWTQIQYIQINAVTSSGTNTLELSCMHLLSDEGLTQEHYDESDQSLTYGDTAYAIDEKTGEAGLLVRGSEEEDNINIQVNDKTFSDGVITAEMVQSFDVNYECGFIFRGGSSSGYMAVVQNGGSPQILLVKFEGGPPTTLGSYGIDLPSFGSSFYLRTEAIGSVIKVYYSLDGENFIKVIEVDDGNDYDASGLLFLHAGGTAETIFKKLEVASHTSVYFDDWGFDDLGLIDILGVQEIQGPENNLVIENIAGSNRSYFQSNQLRSKNIGVNGIIRARSRRELYESINAMKEYLAKPSKSLRIIRQDCFGIIEEKVYDNVTAVDLDRAFEEKSQQKFYTEFEIVFRAPEGIGRSPKIEREAFEFEDSETVYTHTFIGSFSPRPTIEINLTDASPAGGGSIDSIQVANQTTGKTITILNDGAFTDDDVVVLDFENVEVTVNGIQVAYTGLVSDGFFTSGINRLAYSFRANSTLAIDSDLPTSASANEFVGESPAIPSGTVSRIIAQSFEVPVADDYSRFEFQVRIPTGDTPATPKLRIETDSAGSPSGTLATAGAEVVGTEAAIPVTNSVPSYYTPFILGTAASLSTSTTYWAVLSAEGSGIRTAGKFHRNASEGIPTGIIKYSNNGGSSWNDAFSPTDYYDLNMKVYGAKPTGISGTIEVTYNARYV